MALSALPTAVLDGRSVWTTLPMGALLLSGWWAARDRATARTDLTSIARGAAWPATGLAVLWLVVVIGETSRHPARVSEPEAATADR